MESGRNFKFLHENAVCVLVCDEDVFFLGGGGGVSRWRAYLFPFFLFFKKSFKLIYSRKQLHVQKTLSMDSHA